MQTMASVPQVSRWPANSTMYCHIPRDGEWRVAGSYARCTNIPALLQLAAADEEPLLVAAGEVPGLESENPSAAWIRVSVGFLRLAMAVSPALQLLVGSDH